VTPEQTAKFVALLQKGASEARLTKEVGITRQTAARHIAALKEANRVRLYRWKQDSRGRWSVRVWRMGPGIDAEKPTPGRRQRERTKSRNRITTGEQHA
jgi:predicted ArsR family transcriptional regulator